MHTDTTQDQKEASMSSVQSRADDGAACHGAGRRPGKGVLSAACPVPALDELPREVLDTVFANLRQTDLAALSCASRDLNRAAAPHLQRSFRCTTCAAPLFRPQELAKSDWSAVEASPLYANALPRRSFFELDWAKLSSKATQTQHASSSGVKKDAARCAPPPVSVSTVYSGEPNDRDEMMDVDEPADQHASRGGPRGTTLARSVVKSTRDRRGAAGRKRFPIALQPQIPTGAMQVDERAGRANFLVLRHLRQNNMVDSANSVNVRIVRCGTCGVYVGFIVNTGLAQNWTDVQNINNSRTAPWYPLDPTIDGEHSEVTEASDGKEHGARPIAKSYAGAVEDSGPRDDVAPRMDGEHNSHLEPCQKTKVRKLENSACSDIRMFISREFVQLVDGRYQRRNLIGHHLNHHEGNNIYCNTVGCEQLLFERDDLLPWNQVLASTRLSDLDPFLEYEHAWGPGRPALFVRRLTPRANVAVRNVRWVSLRQGNMEIGDLCCRRCARLLGWKFLSELPNGLLHNYDQVGRYGILRDAVLASESRIM